ncbi:MAG: hypothetical protein JSS93_09520 [Bacteroidetes bacterium]|nr:hypothetical protein [Bacteroidota bacterium]
METSVIRFLLAMMILIACHPKATPVIDLSHEYKPRKVIVVVGEPKQTPELHDAVCVPLPDCKCLEDKFCLKGTTLSIKAPDGFRFSGKAVVKCTQDNQGSYLWNARKLLNNPEWITNTDQQKIAVVYTSSWSIQIALACEAIEK